MTTANPSLGIVIASCDKYSDLWQPLFGQFFKHWPNCPYPIYLVANHQRFEHPQVTTLLAGGDIDWSTTMATAIAQLNHSHLLFWIDDAFLTNDVSNQKMEHLFRFVIEHQIQFLRLRPHPKPAKWFNKEIGILNQQAAYRVSLFATIWSVEMLRNILRPGESAWQFEINGTERSRAYEGFYCTKKDIFRYLHGVERGVWILPTAKKMRHMGYAIDGLKRPVMSYFANLSLCYRLFKSWVFHLLSESQRENALRVARRAYKLVGLR
jgi:hypothetical protein